VAGVALMALGWHWWRAWVPVDAVVAAAVGVAGVTLGDIDLHFAWQAWRWLWWRAWVPVDAAVAVAVGMAVCARSLASLHMLPRPATAIHLYSWCWHAGFGYIHTYTRTRIHRGKN